MTADNQDWSTVIGMENSFMDLYIAYFVGAVFGFALGIVFYPSRNWYRDRHRRRAIRDSLKTPAQREYRHELP